MNGETPLIPREVLFGNPDKTMVKISPDGQQLSYLAPVNGVLNVWVGPVADPAAAQPVTQDTDRGIRFYGWAYTGNHLIYIQDKGGDENWRLYVVDLEAAEVTDLTPIEGVQVRLQQVSPHFPEEILIGLNNRQPQFHDIYQVNLRTRRRELIQENTSFAGFVTDEDYRIRLAMRTTPDGGQEYLQPTGTGTWELSPLLGKIGPEDVFTTSPVGFDRSGQALYLVDSRNRDTAALLALDIPTGQVTLLAENPRGDASDVLVHPVEKHVQAVAFAYERKQWQVVDNAIAADMARLAEVSAGDVEILSRTLDDNFWIVAYLLDNGPTRYYLYDRHAQTAQFLFTNRADLEGLPLVKMTPVIIKSRDDKNLVSYYTLPPECTAELPAQSLPLVLLVHGGPWGRDMWGYNPYHQWLANRGYAVLSVNFRGSTGFGKTFINAANGEWAAKMHDDLIDAVDWAIQAGLADSQRVAIMGGSYGGYATLVGLTFTPEIFACGVDIVGPSNLITLLETIPPYWEPEIEIFTTRVGDFRTEAGRAFLAERSPLTHVERIQRPLLIGQGANDPRVKQAESDQIVGAMQTKGIPVTYVLYPDEGHGFARPANRLSFNAVTEAFLARCLEGRYQPIGDDFKGSTLTVLAGAEAIPGLPEALEHQVQ
jgi:dipeptidyl aminopeptidase/acylaminoacyl peptidase